MSFFIGIRAPNSTTFQCLNAFYQAGITFIIGVVEARGNRGQFSVILFTFLKFVSIRSILAYDRF